MPAGSHPKGHVGVLGIGDDEIVVRVPTRQDRGQLAVQCFHGFALSIGFRRTTWRSSGSRLLDQTRVARSTSSMMRTAPFWCSRHRCDMSCCETIIVEAIGHVAGVGHIRSGASHSRPTAGLQPVSHPAMAWLGRSAH